MNSYGKQYNKTPYLLRCDAWLKAASPNETPYLRLCIALLKADEYSIRPMPIPDWHLELWETFCFKQQRIVGIELERVLRELIKVGYRDRRRAKREKEAECVLKSIDFAQLYRKALLRVVVHANAFLVAFFTVPLTDPTQSASIVVLEQHLRKVHDAIDKLRRLNQ